jgi:hypothetical protein
LTTESELALIKAAGKGQLDDVNALLGQGVNVNAQDEAGNAALNEAAYAGHKEVVERLLAAGADIEQKGGADLTPLMNAAVTGNVNLVRLLLAKGARVSNDLLNTIQLKVNILEENAEAGMVLPEAAANWKAFLDFLEAERIWQDLPETLKTLESADSEGQIEALDRLASASRYAVPFTMVRPAVRALTTASDETVRTKAAEVLPLLEKPAGKA